MFRLVLSDEAKEDLQQLFTKEPHAARLIAALIEQASKSQDLLDIFSTQHYGQYEVGEFHVTQLHVHQQQGRNIWRIKHWELERIGLKYRIVYALDSFSSRYHVLAICQRGELGDYKDETKPRIQRIIKAYNRLGIRPISPRR